MDKINRIVSASVSDLTVKEAPEINKGLEAAKAFVATKNAVDIEYKDIGSLVRASAESLPHIYNNVTTNFTELTDALNTKLAEIIIKNEAKSSSRIFYVGAIEATTKDGQPYLIYIVQTA